LAGEGRFVAAEVGLSESRLFLSISFNHSLKNFRSAGTGIAPEAINRDSKLSG
jgi:hypothetical protein